MSIPRTGTVEEIPGSNPTRYRGRLRLDDGSRPRIRIPEPLCLDEGKAAQYVAAMQKLEDAKGLLLAKKQGTAPAGETVSKWFGRYFEWRKTRGFVVQHDVEARLLKYVVDAFADKLMTVTRDDIEGTVQRLDRAIVERNRWFEQPTRGTKTRGAATPACPGSLARTRGATSRARSTKRATRRTGASACSTATRRTVCAGRSAASTVRSRFCFRTSSWRCSPPRASRSTGGPCTRSRGTPARANELAALYAADIDLEHRRISITKQVDRVTGKLRPTKTKRTRTVDIKPALLPLIRALVNAAGEGRLLRMPPDEDRADLLRRHLKVAKCTREALFADDAQRAPVRFHSLRDTCLTFMAVRGDEPLRIQWRAGHTSFAMTEKYIAQARRFEVGFGAPFGPLPLALIEWSTNRSTDGALSHLSAGNNSATPTGIALSCTSPRSRPSLRGRAERTTYRTDK